MTDTPLTAQDFWDRVSGVNAGMLGCEGARAVPMSHQAEPETNSLWFITARGTDLAKAVAAGPQAATYILAGESNLYARVEGELSLVTDQAKLEELWNAVADAWFDDGAQDPDAVALHLRLSEAEIWATTGGLGFLFQLAKAHLTGAEPDMGSHGQIRF